MLPDQIERVRELLAQHKASINMIGDGVNDAPAMAAASISIKWSGAGTDTAIRLADIALMQDDLSKVAEAIQLGRRTVRIIQVNIGFALGVKLFPRARVIRQAAACDSSGYRGDACCHRGCVIRCELNLPKLLPGGEGDISPVPRGSSCLTPCFTRYSCASASLANAWMPFAMMMVLNDSKGTRKNSFRVDLVDANHRTRC